MALRLFLIIGFLTYIVDVTLDCLNAYSHGRNEDRNWMTWTIVIILIPGLINGICTCVAIIPKGSNNDYSFTAKCIGVVMSTLLLGPVFWDFHAFLNWMKKGKPRTRRVENETLERAYQERAHDSVKFGTIQRGIEAAGESIPQWTAQLYFIGIINKISVLQIAGLLSSLFGATYCVIDGTHALTKTLSEHRGRRSHIWDFSFILFGVWMVLAMMTYLAIIALFASTYGGGWIFLLLPFFYVIITVQFFLTQKLKSRWREHHQRISILIQIVVLVVTQVLLHQWKPSPALSYQVQPSISNTSKIEWSVIPLGPSDITIGFQGKVTSHTGVGRRFKASLELLNKSKNHRSYDLNVKLTLKEDDSNITTTPFGAHSCGDKQSHFQWSDVTKVKDPMELFSVFSEKEVVCLSEISAVVANFLMYTNYVWFGYHILVIISLDWLFEDKTESTVDPAPPASSRNSLARNLYVNETVSEQAL